MKPGVFLINTSRGALVNAAAIEGLKSRKIGALGLDVYEQEADGSLKIFRTKSFRMMCLSVC